MGTPFLAEIRMFSCNFAPKGWAMCNGQLLPINQNQALFSLLGTIYGGDGRTTFALPDLRGRVPVHVGAGIAQGQSAGEEAHTLNVSELPAHNHTVNGSQGSPDGTGTAGIAISPNAAGNKWAITAASSYNMQGTTSTGTNALHPAVITNTGGSQPHINMQPYLTLTFCIALQGIFPSQN